MAWLLGTWATPAQAETLYGTFLGGSGADAVNDLAVDSQGRVVIAGRTDSVDWPGYAESPWPRATCSWDCTDGFVARLSADGRRVDWFLWLSGTDYDIATDVAVGPGDVVWVHGVTYSPDFRTVNAPQSQISTSDTFVGRIDAAGTPTMVTFLGGHGFDSAGDIAVAPDGDAVAVGMAREGFKTTPGAVQEQPPSELDSGLRSTRRRGRSSSAATGSGRRTRRRRRAVRRIRRSLGRGLRPGPRQAAVGDRARNARARRPELGRHRAGRTGEVPGRYIDDGWPTTEGAWDRGGWDTPFSAVESLGVTGGGRNWARCSGPRRTRSRWSTTGGS